MMTSQTKKGNPQHRSRSELRAERAKKERQRRDDAGLPVTTPALPACPYCGYEDASVLRGITRFRVSVWLVECCKGVLSSDQLRNVYYPNRKRKSALA